MNDPDFNDDPGFPPLWVGIASFVVLAVGVFIYLAFKVLR